MNYNFDYYAILGVNENATQQQIEEAYTNFKEHEYKTASQWQRKQKEEAYKVLTNPQTKTEYDNFKKQPNSKDNTEQETDTKAIIALLLSIVDSAFLVLTFVVLIWFFFHAFYFDFRSHIHWSWDSFKGCLKPCFCLMFLYYLSRIARASTLIANLLLKK